MKMVMFVTVGLLTMGLPAQVITWAILILWIDTGQFYSCTPNPKEMAPSMRQGLPVFLVPRSASNVSKKILGIVVSEFFLPSKEKGSQELMGVMIFLMMPGSGGAHMLLKQVLASDQQTKHAVDDMGTFV